MGSVLSPCMNICILDPGTGRCTGCKRTREEIQDWGRMSDDERRRVIESLSNRPDYKTSEP